MIGARVGRTGLATVSWGRPDGIAAVVRRLAGEESGWVTGQVIDAEGGYRR